MRLRSAGTTFSATHCPPPTKEVVSDATLRLLRRLYRSQGSWVTLGTLEHAIYGDCVDGGAESATGVIRALICRARERHGAGIIETGPHGSGCYRIPPGLDASGIPGLRIDDRLI